MSIRMKQKSSKKRVKTPVVTSTVPSDSPQDTPVEIEYPRYVNRELSWLQFNRRVLEEAANANNPVLERLKFLAIFESNLDEFYMVRVSGLIEQFEAGLLETSPDGLSPNDQLELISHNAEPLRKRAGQIFAQELVPLLSKSGIAVRKIEDLTERQREDLEKRFLNEIFPLCTPLMLYPAPSLPFISNRSLNIAIELEDAEGEMRLARVKVPTVIPRSIKISERKNEFVLIEDLIIANLKHLFPGVSVKGAHVFRVVRDADVEIREVEAADLISTIEETIRLRRFGDPVLLEVPTSMPDSIRNLLRRLLQLDDDDVFIIDGIIGFDVFWELARIDRPSLRYTPHIPYLSDALANSQGIFETVSSRDLLLHHPYDSFRPIEELVASGMRDPNVFGIKQTLYRVGKESPIVESLLDAAEAGKQVAAMVELKARFDESNNLVWARTLERAGVHVTYGFAEMKTHAKLCLIVRREGKGLKLYAHIGTGNYNPATARLYTDLSLLTTDKEITQDILELFNYLTGFSKQAGYRKLLVAPTNLREGILDRVDREILNAKKGKPARITFKVNSLVDPEIIDALYEASQAGVEVELLVRGICCLRPGVPGLSDNIRVLSVVGRFLEHSRIYWFENAGKPEVYIGSADAMRRNLDRRVEVLAPVESPRLIKHLRDKILDICLKDTVKAWKMLPSGEYERVQSGEEKPFDSQQWFLKHPASRDLIQPSAAPRNRK